MMSTVALKRSWAADLDTATLYKLLKLRVAVFVVEQKCAYPELDGLDLLPETRHFWLDDEGEAICTLRLLEEHDNGVKSFRIGRLCTTPEARGHGYTTRVLQAAIAEAGSATVRLNAQTYLVDLYTKHGFKPEGVEYELDGIPHVPMRRG
ncbi:GNAT family N-acetyltransferase [Nocardia nova]|uniref:Acetyltransferase (GNAT) domain-containing protein n=1 Tax=Nocardia nova SH22a TaxID=1415166 RepID=W5TMT9_9NOCA|nr:GNAT family N-acetyltransferase [Nocardia nova]AHH20303.1 acetyltransferase (GNAT) domain-containing protein [Nocardia nova SH22a]